jgi:hypothetical protein
MSRTPIVTALILLAFAPVVGVAPAYGSAASVIRDCSEDGVLDRHYSAKELTGALDTLPSDLDEYTDCRSVIRRAQLAGARGKEKRRPGILDRVDRTKPPSTEEQDLINRASRSPGPVHVGGTPIEPGAAGGPLSTSGLGTTIPTFVLLALIALGTAALWGGAFASRRRWPNAWRLAEGAVARPVRQIGDGVKRGIARFRR